MPRFEAFRALRYAPFLHLNDVTAPPYDVISESERVALFARHPNNISHLDMPTGVDAYRVAGNTLRQWIRESVLIQDDVPSLTLYRMSFIDSFRTQRSSVGVLGALEVLDEGAGGVLPHERTTPKAKTDRLELTRATDSNLSPIWGLSLAAGLSDKLAAPGEPRGALTDPDGVVHSVERISDPARIADISELVSAHPVVIADGHHRYAVSRTFRDEVRQRTHRSDSAAELTLAYVGELADDQLSVAAIHRLYREISIGDVRNALALSFEIENAGLLNETTLQQMSDLGVLCLLLADRSIAWLKPKPESFVGVRLQAAVSTRCRSAAPRLSSEQLPARLRAGVVRREGAVDSQLVQRHVEGRPEGGD
ncbi:MAG: DUF1015 domain-containing protein, partial [Ilumatobacteraceae bacterium]